MVIAQTQAQAQDSSTESVRVLHCQAARVLALEGLEKWFETIAQDATGQPLRALKWRELLGDRWDDLTACVQLAPGNCQSPAAMPVVELIGKACEIVISRWPQITQRANEPPWSEVREFYYLWTANPNDVNLAAIALARAGQLSSAFYAAAESGGAPAAPGSLGFDCPRYASAVEIPADLRTTPVALITVAGVAVALLAGLVIWYWPSSRTRHNPTEVVPSRGSRVRVRVRSTGGRDALRRTSTAQR